MRPGNKAQIPNEEFSIEFGDVNGTKLFETLQIPYKEKKKNEDKKQKYAGLKPARLFFSEGENNGFFIRSLKIGN